MSIGDNQGHPTSETVYLELSEGQSHKFYEVTVIETLITIRYGRIGTSGQLSNSTYVTPEKAQAEATKKINEKLRKGYVRVFSQGDRPTPDDQLPDPATSSTTSGISSRMMNLAELPVTTSGGREILKFSLQKSLVAVELIATCNIPTFTINLCIEPNIAYHFDVRSHQGQIVQNTCINRVWGREERLSIPVELISCQPFVLKIAVEETLVVYLNEQILSQYSHRLPANQIHSIDITSPPDNFQIQTIQVFEQTDVEIAIPESTLPEVMPEAPAPKSVPTRPSPPLPVVDPGIRPPSAALLNQATHGQSFPPSVTRNHLRFVRYPLGFVLHELKYCYLSIPLARSLVCFELVGTITNQTPGRLSVRLAADQDIVWAGDFDLNQGQIVQWSGVDNVISAQENISLPSPIVSGQMLHFVLTLTKGNIVFYLNNQSFAYNPQARSSAPPDTLHLNYDTAGFKLQLARVLEPLAATTQVTRSTLAIAPLPSQLAPSPSSTVTQSTIAPPDQPEIPQWLRDLPSQFQPLRPFLEAKLQTYIKIQVGERVQWLNSPWETDPLEPWHSKIGGHPYLPKGTAYPTDHSTGRMMLFLMQINCADLPIIDGFSLPRQGILQFYSGLNVPMCELSPEQHRILYFPEISQDRSELIADFSLLSEFAQWQEWYKEIYPLTFDTQQDVFFVDRHGYINTFDVPEELESLCNDFHVWLDETEDLGISDQRENKLGGEVEPNAWETVEYAQGELLLEINHPDACDDYFYFFIEAKDLVNLDFSKVESYFRRD